MIRRFLRSIKSSWTPKLQQWGGCERREELFLCFRCGGVSSREDSGSSRTLRDLCFFSKYVNSKAPRSSSWSPAKITSSEEFPCVISKNGRGGGGERQLWEITSQRWIWLVSCAQRTSPGPIRIIWRGYFWSGAEKHLDLCGGREGLSLRLICCSEGGHHGKKPGKRRGERMRDFHESSRRMIKDGDPLLFLVRWRDFSDHLPGLLEPDFLLTPN